MNRFGLKGIIPSIFIVLLFSFSLIFTYSDLYSDGPSPTTTDEPKSETATLGESSYKGELTVTRIVDGDTIVISDNHYDYTIRLIGIDTPETKAPNTPIQCFGREATNFLTNLILGKKVKAEFDESQGDVDKYNRLLRYIFLEEENINLKMISEGFAFEYTYNLPYQYQEEFIEAEINARSDQKGLWSPTTCSGEKKSLGS